MSDLVAQLRDEIARLQDSNDLLRSRLSNARNILHFYGFVYAKELDKVLGNRIKRAGDERL